MILAYGQGNPTTYIEMAQLQKAQAREQNPSLVLRAGENST
jgi:hypothetical protein